MIEISNLNFTYPNSSEEVLKGVSISFSESGLYYIVGESGSGKSTFMNILSGSISDYVGSVKFNGMEIGGFNQNERDEYLRNTCSISFQEDILYPHKTAIENIRLSLEVCDMSDIEKNNRIREVVNRLNISTLLDKKVEFLSGGEAKRVSLAQSLVKDYRILLLDEPMGKLDENNREKLTNLFLELSRKSLVILITHNRSEIPEEANVLELKNGKFSLLKEGKRSDGRNARRDNTGSRRKNSDFYSNITRGFSMLKERKTHTYFSCFSITIALVTISLITLISTSISSSLKGYFSGVINSNSVLVQPRNSQVIDDSYVSTSFGKMKSIQKKYSEAIMGVGAHYDINFENMFINRNEVYFNIDSKKFTLSSFSVRSFEEFTYAKEIESYLGDIENKKLNDDQIILGLTYEDICFIGKKAGIEKNILENINELFSTKKIPLHLDIACSYIGYELESLFEVDRIVETDIPRIIHTNPLFAEYFVESNMRFQGNAKYMDEYSRPWIVHKVYFLYFVENKKRETLKKIETDSEFSSTVYHNMKQRYLQLDGENVISKNRVEFYEDYIRTISISKIEKMIGTYAGNVKNYFISDGFYYYAKEGIVSGFLHPIFVSSKLDKLNEIADYNYSSDFDLHGFQGSSIIFDSGVIMGDLSGTQEKPLKFCPYIKTPNIDRGYLPMNENQVLISSNLAIQLFGTTNVISSNLYLSCLTSTEYFSGGYKNIFEDGKLVITGVIDSQENEIYQEPRFLRALGEDQFNLPISDKEIERVVLNFDDDISLDGVMRYLTKAYPEYEFSTPAKEIEEGIDQIVDYIDLGLSIFASISGIISISLMVEVMILFISKGEKINVMLKHLGWSKKDISKSYWFGSLLVGAFSWINSYFTIKICEVYLHKSLIEQMNLSIDFPNFKILLFTLIFTILTSLISILFTKNKIQKGKK